MIQSELPISLVLPEDFLNEETRDGFLVTQSTKAIWAIELDLLNEFMHVCEENNLSYYAIGGTLLGAIRHRGFIPWDDDIDIAMKREEYEKLCKIGPSVFNKQYFLQTEFTDRFSARGHAQLRNSLTTGILLSEKKKGIHFNQGIFIDIFPLDSAPDKAIERDAFLKIIQKKKEKYTYEKNLIYAYSIKDSKLSLRLIIEYLKHLTRTFAMPKYFDKRYVEFEDFLTSKLYTSSHKYVMTPFFWDKYVWDKESFKKSMCQEFEFLSIPIPIGYDEILTKNFGEWKTPVKGGSLHGGIFFDPSKPYTHYIE